MPKAKKRTPSNTSSNVVQAMLDAGMEPLKPPKHVRMRKEDMPFWDGIILARARSEWTALDLVIAAQLARCQRDIEVQTETLEDEGSTLTNFRGTEIMNPRVSVAERLAIRQLAYMRALRMGGKAAGDPRDETARRRAQENAKSITKELEDESLFA